MNICGYIFIYSEKDNADVNYVMINGAKERLIFEVFNMPRNYYQYGRIAFN